MAIPSAETLRTLTLADFTKAYVYKPSIFEEVFRKRPTEAQFRREVDKLKSVSEAGKRWIVDERCKWASIGKHAGTIQLRKRNAY